MPLHTFVGEGSYGCVHRPSLQCRDKKITYKNKISKTMTTKHANSELHEYDVLVKADKKKEFYLGKPVKCKPKETPHNIKALEKCKILKKYLGTTTINGNMKKLALLVMDDGGPELKMFSKTIESLQVTHANKIIVEKFLIEMDRMFAGIILFYENEFLHHDIKPQNVLYDIKKNRANYIDFGLASKYDTIINSSRESDNTLADYAFWTFPFEIQFLNKNTFMKYTRMSDASKRKFVDTTIAYFHKGTDTKFNSALKLFFEYILYKEPIKEKNAILQKYFDEFKNMMINELYEDNYERFLKRSIETIDVYGLGMTMSYVISRCKDFIDTEIYDDFLECFYNMTRPNLFKRYDVYEAREKYDEILKKSGFLQDAHTSIIPHGVQPRNDKKIHFSARIYKTRVTCPKNKICNASRKICKNGVFNGKKCVKKTVKRRR